MPTYAAYNLVLECPLPCPELRPAQGNPHVSVRYGEVPRTLAEPVQQGALYQAGENQFLLNLDNIARFLVQNGDEIIIDRAPNATDDEVRLFLLGSCLGALLHQRGILALHSGAIQTERGAVLFTGQSGAGKSTLLSAFLQRGYKMLADDIAGIAPNGQNTPVVLPGYPQAKLWGDAAEKLAHQTDELRRVRPQLEKFALPTVDQFAAKPIPLYAVYVLIPHNQPDLRLEPVVNTDKFNVFVHHTYRRHFLEGLGLRPAHFQLAAAAAQKAVARQVHRPQHPFLLDELADLIEADFNR